MEGTRDFTTSNAFGKCIYRVNYSVPNLIITGQTAQIFVSVDVVQIGGSTKSIITDSVTCHLTTASETKTFTTIKNEVRELGQGATWGPIKLEYQLKDSDIRLGQGQSMRGTVSINVKFFETAQVVGGKFEKTLNIDGLPIEIKSNKAILPTLAGAGELMTLAVALIIFVIAILVAVLILAKRRYM